MVHINDKDKNNINLEKINLESKKDNSIKFITDEFSVFTLLANNTKEANPNVLVIDTAKNDRDFFKGKNFYDGDTGYNTNDYKDSDLNDVEIQYYGYNLENNTSKYQTTVKSTYASGNQKYDSFDDKYYYERIFELEVKNPGGTLDTSIPWHLDISLNNELNKNFSLKLSRESKHNKNVDISYNEISAEKGIISVRFKDHVLNGIQGKNSYTLNLYLFFKDMPGNIEPALYDINLVSEKAKTGYISAAERIDQINYKKCLKSDELGNIRIELIDNPFCSRPYGNGFNGWLTTSTEAHIETDSKTYEQVLTIPKDKISTDADGKKIIKLYTDWKPANWVEYNGKWSDASNKLKSFTAPENRKASAREFNILIVGDNKSVNITEIDALNIPLTITSQKDDVDYTGEIIIESNISLKNDFQMEHIRVISDSEFKVENGNSLVTNLYNTRIGRGVETLKNRSVFRNVSTYRKSGGSYKSRLVIESGQYYTLQCLNNTSLGNSINNISSKVILGNDIDRVKPLPEGENYKHLFKVYFRISERISSLKTKAFQDNEPIYLGERYTNCASMQIVKSGQIGIGYFDDHAPSNDSGRWGEVPYSGVYVGTVSIGDNSTGDYSDRVLFVEGGQISNINGGLGTTDENTSKTKIFVKNGEIYNIVGGAGRSETSGNRYIHVTGGKVIGSVSGGSNGYLSYDGEGSISGEAYVYVGGDAIIGDTTKRSSTLYGVTIGSIVGAGNGNSDSDVLDGYGTNIGCGNVKRAAIVINDNAKINGNVYGAGNFGTVYGVKTIDEPPFVPPNIQQNELTQNKYIISSGYLDFSKTLFDNNNNLSYGVIDGDQPKNASSKYTVEFDLKNVKVGEKYKLKWVNGGFDWVYDAPIFEDNYFIKLNGKYIYFDPNIKEVKFVNSIENASNFQVNISNNNNISLYANYGRKENGWDVTETYDYLIYDPTQSNFIISDESYYNSGMYLFDKKVEIPKETEKPKDYIVKINILNGDIEGDVYGGGNSNGVNGDVKIQVDNGTIHGTLYGGTFDNGKIEGYSDIVINGGIFVNDNATNLDSNKIFGGGKGSKTLIRKGNSIKISDTLNQINIEGNIYGGSENGKIGNNINNDSSILEITESDAVEKNITITGNVYGGGMGGAQGDRTINTAGNVKVSINGIKFDTLDVYGAYNAFGTVNGNINIDIGDKLPTHVNQVFGCGNEAELGQGTIGVESVNLKIHPGSRASKVFGGGNSAGSQRLSNVTISGGIVTEVYGGSNLTGDVYKSNVLLDKQAVVNNVYGGGLGVNANITNGTNVKIDASTVTENVYGGGKSGGIFIENNPQTSNQIQNATKVNLNTAHVKNVYGGGEEGPVSGNTDVEVNDSVVNNVYGGGLGKGADIKQNTTITVNNIPENKRINNIYGGGDLGKVEGQTKIISTNSYTNNIYGGGNKAEVGGKTELEIKENSNSNNIYGGGNEGNVIKDTNITLNASKAINIYGGGNLADINNSTIKIESVSTTTKVYGGGDQGNVITDTSVSITDSNVIENVFGGGSGSDNKATKKGCVGGNTSVKIQGGTTVAQNVFGAGQGASTEVAGDTNVLVENAKVTQSCYGGGDNGTVKKTTKVTLSGAEIGESAFAAGNGALAEVHGNSYILSEGYTGINGIINTNIAKSIFGGGNASPTGVPTANTSKGIVDITGAIVGENVYGGANSSVIYGSTYVNIGIDAIKEANLTPNEIVDKYVKAPIQIKGTVFGGGESMDPTSDDFNYDTVSVTKDLYIRINENLHKDTGGINIGGSIFGSGNASRAEGHREIDIRNMGQCANENNGFTEEIKKLVSIQRAVTVRVDNSNLAIKGTKDSTSKFNEFDYSLNRIDNFVLKNDSTLYLESGANLLCSYRSAVGLDKNSKDLSKPLDDLAEVKIKNSIITEKNGTFPNDNQRMEENKIYSNMTNQVVYYIKQGKLYDTNNQVVDKILTYQTDDVLPTSNNRIYMMSGKNLNVATTENIISYGDVKGMTFFGIYKSFNGDEKYKGMYAPNYAINNPINFDDRDYLRSYVLGLHASGHDIYKDGFYTNFEKLDESLLKPDVKVTEENYQAYSYTNFITPTPDNDAYYMWFAGPDDEVYNYEVKLTASKFSTYGTFDLKLLKISYPNTELKMNKVENYLKDGARIIDKNLVPHINNDQEKANKEFGLEMRTSNSSWAMNGSTDILAESPGQASYKGTEEYITENSSSTPVLSFYLQNSNNITEINPDLGYVRVFMDMSYWKDPLSQGFAKVIIDVKIATQVYDEHGYNGSITPGTYYDLFTTYPTNITTKSSFSTYFELSEEKFLENPTVSQCYNNSYRAIETDFILPEGTTITMIDKSLGNDLKYYYYDVTKKDQLSKTQKFRLSNFIAMGSTDEKYDEVREREKYYDMATKYQYECFIFIFNFEHAKFPAPIDPATGLITKKSKVRMSLYGSLPGSTVEQMIFKLLDAQIEKMNYSIYDVESLIEINPGLSSNKIYLGNSVNLNVITSFRQLDVGGVAVQDTNYFDKKLGLRISFLNEQNKTISGVELIGTVLRHNGVDYFPRDDGTIRIKVADKVSNSSANIEIDTANSSLESGKYKVKVESFGSADGIYFGINPSDTKEVPLELVNDIYGMKATIPEEQAVIDSKTGFTLEKNTGYISKDNNIINTNLEYISGLTSPIVTVSLERRNYDTNEIYDTNYTKVDLKDYVTNTLTLYDATRIPLEYTFKTPDEINATVIDKTVPVNFKLDLTLKQQLKTGTYRLKFKLLDQNQVKKLRPIKQPDGSIKYEEYFETVYQEIGDSFVYIVIK